MKKIIAIFILWLLPVLGNSADIDITYDDDASLPRNLKSQVQNYVNQNNFKDRSAHRFEIKQTQKDKLGLRHVTLQQKYRGIPVYGGVIKFHFRNDDYLSSVSDHTVGSMGVSTKSKVSAQQARRIAEVDFRQKLGIRYSTLKSYEVFVGTPTIYIYDEALFSDVMSDPILVWRFQIDIPGKPISRLYYIDALDGSILYSLNNVADALSRETYALSETPDCNTETLTYDETTSPVTYDTDEALVHQYAGYAYDYFYDTFGRDSYNDEDPDDATDGGGTIKSYTHYRDAKDSCADTFDAAWVNQETEPYEFMYFAEGVYGPDIVGHELTHGVVDYSAEFEYKNESGALDESYADIFGSMIEHSTGETDWTIGEDLPTSRPSECTTALRSLEDPTGYTGQCDGSGDTLPSYYEDRNTLAEGEEASDSNDNGYVHTNSSIANYAFYLLSEGGTHPTSGATVTGIGEEIAADIYYQTLTNYLSTTSDFTDAYTQTIAACLDLNAVDSITYPITYCDSVQQAFYAVGIADTESYLEADIATSTESGYAPLAVDFDGSDSFALNASIMDYNWDLDSTVDSDGDGSATNDTDNTGPLASYTYSAVGTPQARLTITDDTGNSTHETTTITVQNPIDASFTASSTATTTTAAVTFDATGSTDQTGTITDYTWDFGDGSTDSGGTVSYTYTNPGTYVVTLTVIDSGGYVANTTTTITVYVSGTNN